MHLVYYLREPGEEFRYSLRSVAANLPVERVTIIGDAPTWFKYGKVLDGNPTHDAHVNSVANAHIASRAFPEEFVMFNDDFYAMTPQTEIPNWYFNTLTAHVGLYQDPRSAKWKQLYMNTAKYLTYARVMMPKSFELHVPMRVQGRELNAILDRSARDANLAGPGLWRSLYGNLSETVRGEGITQREDVKIHSARKYHDHPDYISTDEKTVTPILALLRDQFPERSRWEKK